jgi:hypothetical protein
VRIVGQHGGGKDPHEVSDGAALVDLDAAVQTDVPTERRVSLKIRKSTDAQVHSRRDALSDRGVMAGLKAVLEGRARVDHGVRPDKAAGAEDQRASVRQFGRLANRAVAPDDGAAPQADPAVHQSEGPNFYVVRNLGSVIDDGGGMDHLVRSGAFTPEIVPVGSTGPRLSSVRPITRHGLPTATE